MEYDKYEGEPFTVFIFCDFSTLNCDKFTFMKFLKGYAEDVQNINDSLWVIRNYRVPAIPFDPMIDHLLDDLIKEGLATKETNLIVSVPKWNFGRFCGLEDLLIGRQ